MSNVISPVIDVETEEELEAAKADLRARGFNGFGVCMTKVGRPTAVYGQWLTKNVIGMPLAVSVGPTQTMEEIPEEWRKFSREDGTD
jgi:hypothetical protein